jgi:hypothetical protein
VSAPAIPQRPAAVPEGAHYLPPAGDFSALKELNESRASKRSLLRVWFPFAIFRIRGPLQGVHHRAITTRPTRYGESQVFCFSNVDEPVPGVWVWTLDDERAAL